MRTLRKLVLGETWALPIGSAVAVGVAAILAAVAGSADRWTDAGGFILSRGLRERSSRRSEFAADTV